MPLITLQKRLTLLCGLTTSSILSLALCIVLVFSLIQDNKHTLELFNKSTFSLVEEIRYTQKVHHTWLNQIESQNNLIIYIEDQGVPISFSGNLQPPTPRSTLIEQLNLHALSEGINTHFPPTNNHTSSTILNLNYGPNEHYRGQTFLFALPDGWRTLIVIQYLPQHLNQILRKCLIFLFIDLIGCILLFILSHIFINKAIQPVFEAQKRQVEFIAAASHELRSPLTVIQTGLSSFKDNLPLASSYLPTIENECKRMNRLINDMLFLATSDANTWSIHTETIDMDTLLIEVYDLLCPFTNTSHHELFLDLPNAPLPIIKGDPERLKQLLTILIDNAIHYSPEHTPIYLRSHATKCHLIIEVEDHGPGIPSTQKHLIFNRFYRSTESRTNKNHFGLGLSIAYELTNLHGGNILVGDTSGGGATFIIQLPLI
ncbi:MAG: sensor histidine kinase [Cellulosilyticaceae bacterium]